MQKKSILFIADKPDWAYHNIIKTWAETLSEDFDCFVAFAEDFAIKKGDFSLFIRVFYNTVHAFLGKEKYMKIDRSGRFSLPVYKNPPVYHALNLEKTSKSEFDFTIEMAYYFQYTAALPFVSNKKLVGIYTDSFPHEGPSFDIKRNQELKNLNRQAFYEQYLKHYDGIIVGNINLLEDYRVFTDKIIFANGIYRQNEFEENQNVGENEGLLIGWTGNPNRTMKGFNEVIVPAVEKVKNSGRNVALKTQFSGTYDSILSFYKDVDLVAIASDADTGPSLFSEASLSCVPSISTPIGFPKMVIKNQENGIIISRDIDELYHAIIELYDHREKLKAFSAKIKSNYLNQLDNANSIKNLKLFLKNLKP